MTILEKLPDAEPVIPAAELIQTGPVNVDKSSEIVVETPMPDLFDDATTVTKTEDASTSKRTQVWPKLCIFLSTNFDFKNPKKQRKKQSLCICTTLWLVTDSYFQGYYHITFHIVQPNINFIF